MIFPFFLSVVLTRRRLARSERGDENAERALSCPRPRIQICLTTLSLAKISSARQAQSPPANRCFQFQKRSQVFIRTDNETLSVTAVSVSNRVRPPLRRSPNSIPLC